MSRGIRMDNVKRKPEPSKKVTKKMIKEDRELRNMKVAYFKSTGEQRAARRNKKK